MVTLRMYDSLIIRFHSGNLAYQFLVSRAFPCLEEAPAPVVHQFVLGHHGEVWHHNIGFLIADMGAIPCFKCLRNSHGLLLNFERRLSEKFYPVHILPKVKKCHFMLLFQGLFVILSMLRLHHL